MELFYDNEMSDNNNDDEKTNSPLEQTSIVQSETFKVRLAQAGQAPPCLVLLMGPANSIGRQWSIDDTDRVLGRSPAAHIHIDDQSVSKSHAKLLLAAGDVSIIDLESTNKTVLNGKIVAPLVPVKLRNNDQIKVGNVIFKFLEQGNIETVSVAQTFDRGQTDALTGVNNRGALEARAPDDFKKSDLLGVDLCVVIFDIDHFKKVNDTYGHSAGDHVLIELSKIVSQKMIRGNDFFARSGGEEFTLLLLGSQIDKAMEIADRIRQTIEAHEFSYEGTIIPITISVGVAIKAAGDEEWKNVYDRADEALYMSKENGRNQVTKK